MKDLYKEHVRQLQNKYEAILETLERDGQPIEAVLLHSGTESYYFADDIHIPFRTVPHFAHWLPLQGPDHLLLVQPGKKPFLIKHVPKDFWYEVPDSRNEYWMEEFDIVEVDSLDKLSAFLPDDLSGTAYIGDNEAFASSIGIELIAPRKLMTRLDFARSIKTPYEVECTRQAAAKAARGHLAAAQAFREGASEYEIHIRYLMACEATDSQMPYNTIVALDEKAAILHYQNKRGRGATTGNLLLIDAGARVNGYCSDITRTYLREGQDSLFYGILNRMEDLQSSLVEMVKPGVDYVELHREAHRGVARILSETGLVRLSPEEIFERGYTQPFFPHGLGHLLGIQVHDVSGHYADEDGSLLLPPKEYPFLRFTRKIVAGNLFTIEPGFYFIPMLLEPFRNSQHSIDFDWETIDRLTPLGGIRIEDDIFVTEEGYENLTRPYLP
ncbi:MAG: Xaa-Pro dipeptidase [Acidobacteriota bacterium]|nr:Xaa-Pro dipeptidase [Blastocatellia bacterium]MDW8412073.1 Xaa-Pro dipeptidase [Acidobacteriota bacterium]